MPEGAVYVGRGSKWGNPFEVYRCPCCQAWDVRDNNGVTYLAAHGYIRSHPEVTVYKAEAVAKAVGLYAHDLGWGTAAITPEDIQASLRGKDLACWCPLDQPCHADVLLGLANGGA